MSIKSIVPEENKRSFKLDLKVTIDSVDFWDELKNIDRIMSTINLELSKEIKDYLCEKLLGGFIIEKYDTSFDQIKFTVDKVVAYTQSRE